MHQDRSRATVAEHFHALTQISREEIFGAKAADVMPVNLPNDASTMFSGFVGPKYHQGLGVVLLAINPGGGGDAYTRRIPEDEVFYPLLHAFKAARGGAVEPAFEAVNLAFMPIVKGWNLWRILGPTLDAARLTIESIAYMNVVPYRTRADKMPPAASRRAAWSNVVAPSLELLEPSAVIALGKKAGSVVKPLLSDETPYYCVPRTIGDSYISDDAKVILADISRDFQ